MTSPTNEKVKRQVAPLPPTTSDVIIFPYNRLTNSFVTAFYSSGMTQNRLKITEVHQFLEEVKVPANEYYQKFGFLTDGSKKLSCIFILCIIFFPLLFVYLHWISKMKNKDDQARAEVIKKANSIAKQKAKSLIRKGIKWVIPPEYPRWIELWTNVGPLTPLIPSPTHTPNSTFLEGRKSAQSESLLKLSPEKVRSSPEKSRSPEKAKTENKFVRGMDRSTSMADMDESEQGYYMRSKNKAKTHAHVHVSKTYTYNI